MAKLKSKLEPRPTMCATCPWREGSPYAYLRPALEEDSARHTRICHSTGNNAINPRTGKLSMACRGSRNFQLDLMYGLGMIKAPTDEAWEEKCQELGIR